MIVVIVKPSKKLVVVNENCNCADDVGVIDEFNATSLKFEFPKKIEGVPIEVFNKEIILQNASGIMSDELTSDIFRLAKKHTKYPQIRIQVKLTTPDMEWISFPTLFTFAEHLTATAVPIEPDPPPSDDEPENPDTPTEEHECVTICGFFGVPEVRNLTCRGAPIRIVIPRGKILKRVPFGEVKFAEGVKLIEGNIYPEYQIGTDIENASIIIIMDDPIDPWGFILGRDPNIIVPDWPHETIDFPDE